MSSKKEAIFIALLIILWYTSNIGVLLLNKLLLSNYGFGFPIFLTMCHMSACAILSYISIVFLKVVPLQRVKSRSQLIKIGTLSLVFCGSVVGGNVSLRYIPVSFNQAVGATTPFFTALFAYFMIFKREAWVTYACLVPVVGGVIIASGGEPSFHLYGFIMCISATAARAFKSVLQGILLSSEGEKLNSMNLLLYMSPIAVISLIPAVFVMEPNVLQVFLSLGLQYKFMWLLLLLNSAMAYSANLSNFLVTKHTSALTLQEAMADNTRSHTTSRDVEPLHAALNWRFMAIDAKMKVMQHVVKGLSLLIISIIGSVPGPSTFPAPVNHPTVVTTDRDLRCH